MGIYIIAEAGVNHNGSFELACQLVDAAKAANVDAVKFQTFVPEQLVTASADRSTYQKNNMPGESISQLDMLRQLALSQSDFVKLKAYCDAQHIEFLSTPFDTESADFLEPLQRLYKISSGDAVNFPFLKYIAQKGKPMIVSTGMCTPDEISEIVEFITSVQPPLPSSDFPPLTLLHCTTDYPCPFSDVNLFAMTTLSKRFGIPVGYSDHTVGIEISVAAAALGAQVIEKHFTLDRTMKGPDHKASLEPGELQALVESVRHVEAAIGNGEKTISEREREALQVARKSLVLKESATAGSVISEHMLSAKRPGTGIPPKAFQSVIGQTITTNLPKDHVLSWNDFK